MVGEPITYGRPPITDTDATTSTTSRTTTTDSDQSSSSSPSSSSDQSNTSSSSSLLEVHHVMSAQLKGGESICDSFNLFVPPTADISSSSDVTTMFDLVELEVSLYFNNPDEWSGDGGNIFPQNMELTVVSNNGIKNPVFVSAASTNTISSSIMSSSSSSTSSAAVAIGGVDVSVGIANYSIYSWPQEWYGTTTGIYKATIDLTTSADAVILQAHSSSSSDYTIVDGTNYQCFSSSHIVQSKESTTDDHCQCNNKNTNWQLHLMNGLAGSESTTYNMTLTMRFAPTAAHIITESSTAYAELSKSTSSDSISGSITSSSGESLQKEQQLNDVKTHSDSISDKKHTKKHKNDHNNHSNSTVKEFGENDDGEESSSTEQEVAISQAEASQGSDGQQDLEIIHFGPLFLGVRLDLTVLKFVNDRRIISRFNHTGSYSTV